jgi:protein-disulfide isomerase
MRRSAALALLSILALAVPASAKAPAKAPAKPAARADWTRTFSVTAQGGFRMGNPKAKIAVVEYGSLTCPHCRHFAETAVNPLVAQYVRTGKASYEFRPFILDGIDVAANLLARCSGPAPFFPMAADLYATQPMWRARISDADMERFGALPQGQMMVGIAEQAGLILTGAAHGIAPAKARACLSDEAAAERLATMRQAASASGVTGTPTLLVNGKVVPAYDWTSLQPFLKRAGG